jgi:hypothetical protein
MGNLIAMLVDVVASIWQADSDLRDNSVFGESPMERKDRKFVGWICGSVIVLLIVGGFIWWWRAGTK